MPNYYHQTLATWRQPFCRQAKTIFYRQPFTKGILISKTPMVNPNHNHVQLVDNMPFLEYCSILPSHCQNLGSFSSQFVHELYFCQTHINSSFSSCSGARNFHISIYQHHHGSCLVWHSCCSMHLQSCTSNINSLIGTKRDMSGFSEKYYLPLIRNITSSCIVQI